MGSAKKILIVCPLRAEGGVEAHVLRLSRLLRDGGAAVTVASRVVSRDAPVRWFAQEPGVHFVSTPFSRRPDWPRAAMAWALQVWPRQLGNGFDVLYTLDMSRLPARLACLVNASGYVIGNRVGAVPDGPFADAATEQVLDGFIAETETQLAGYQTSVPRRAIPHLSAPHPASAQRAPARGSLRVAYLGRYERAKGILRLVDIWREARPEGAELAFYGAGPDRGELKNYLAANGLANEVRVHGPWRTGEEQSAILSSVDLVVLPSESEGLPLVLLEAMAHGVPFLATRVGGIPELAMPDVAIVPLDNARFAAELNGMLGRIRRGEISAGRLQRFHEERYSFEQVARSWISALLEPEQFWEGGSARTGSDKMK
ncbi:MAG: glycosyltransferase family 4 protein [Acidobacteria bacterium]|nr:glycosyltransferase family 4 protein [Acidobacteriota bacterium]